MIPKQRIAGKPSRIVRLPKSAGLPRSKAMLLYRTQLRKYHKPGSGRFLSQRTFDRNRQLVVQRANHSPRSRVGARYECQLCLVLWQPKQ